MGETSDLKKTSKKTTKTSKKTKTASKGMPSKKTSKTPKTSKTKTPSKKTPPKKTTPKKDSCTVANTFMRAVDAKLATYVKNDITCKEFAAMVTSLAKKHSGSDKVLPSIVHVGKIMLKTATCKGDVVANVAELRRVFAGVACTMSGNKVMVSVSDEETTAKAPPLPKGFVVPRLWDAKWTPAWARRNGWIKDPYYDWLMPVAQVETKPLVTVVNEEMPVNPTPAAPATTSSTPATSAPATSAPAPVAEPPKVAAPVAQITAVEPDSDEPDSDEPDSDLEDTPTPAKTDIEKTADAELSDDDLLALIPGRTENPTGNTTSSDSTTTAAGTTTKKWVRWAMIGGIVVFLAGVMLWILWRSRRGAAGGGNVDEAFDAAEPPTNMPLETPGIDLPNTTDLMNDLAPSRRRR